MKARREYVEKLLRESKEKCTFEENEEFLKSSSGEMNSNSSHSPSISKLEQMGGGLANFSPKFNEIKEDLPTLIKPNPEDGTPSQIRYKGKMKMKDVKIPE